MDDNFPLSHFHLENIIDRHFVRIPSHLLLDFPHQRFFPDTPGGAFGALSLPGADPGMIVAFVPIPLIGLSGVRGTALGTEDFYVEWVGVSVGASHTGCCLTGSSCGCQTWTRRRQNTGHIFRGFSYQKGHRDSLNDIINSIILYFKKYYCVFITDMILSAVII